MNQIFLETRMFRLSDGEEIMTLAFFVLIQYRSVTDGQTDIRPLAIPAVCIARYANALVKTFGELWSPNKKVLLANIEPPKCIFRGRLHFSPYGVLPPQTLIRARD